MHPSCHGSDIPSRMRVVATDIEGGCPRMGDIVMLHDQGHIAAKLLAQNAVAALTIGSPILFSSVAHGSAHDIAGKGVADATAMIEAVLRLSKVKERLGLQPAPARSAGAADSIRHSRCQPTANSATRQTWAVAPCCTS